MLAKINFKTACDCTKHIFESDFKLPVPWRYVVPISGPTPFTEPSLGRSTSYSLRTFGLIRGHRRSRQRIELWYEEILYA